MTRALRSATKATRQQLKGNAMKLPRRQFFHLAAGAAALSTLPRTVNAQAYPTQPVRIIVGFAAGSGSDIMARLMAQWLTERLGQPILIENRPGGGGNVGTEAVVKAPPDGYTLLKTAPANTVNDTLYDKLSFNFIRDIAPVAGMVRVPFVLVVNQSVPVTTVPEFITYAKANPGKLNFASAGVGTGIHMSGELFKLMAGVNMVHVPYRGAGNAMTDLIGGQVQLMFDTTQASIPHIRAGKVRALAVTTKVRSELLPDLPTIGDFVPGYESSGLFGFGAPRNTPAEIVEKLNREINAVLADPKAKARIVELGGEPLAGPPAEFGRLLADEAEKWGKVIRAANIKVE
jgi:tripartite-type tricarboxylate transporter receptor subunit TctC